MRSILTTNMDYLKIENPGFSSYKAMILLGGGTSSGEDEVIGMFGSGFKHAVLTCLRADAPPIIYSNNLSMEYYLKDVILTDFINAAKTKQEVHYKLKGKDEEGRQINRDETTNWTLNWASGDWHSIYMGLREFISNAYDHTFKLTKSHDDAVIEIVPEKSVRAKSGTTRIFIPAIPEVLEYYNNMGKRFLHRKKQQNTFGVLHKDNRELDGTKKAMIYKKGVFVRQPGYAKPALFDYNFGNELVLDEARNADDYTVAKQAARRLFNEKSNDKRKILLKSLAKNEDSWESGFSEHYLLYDLEEHKDLLCNNWKQSFRECFGNTAVLSPPIDLVINTLKGKGFIPVVINQPGWLMALAKVQLASYDKVLNKDELEGISYHETPKCVEDALEFIWNKLVSLSATNNKLKPQVSVFTKQMEAGANLFGYYKPGEDKIYINKQLADENSNRLKKTVLEEVAHYVTGATDNSKDFQEYFMWLLINTWNPSK